MVYCRSEIAVKCDLEKKVHHVLSIEQIYQMI